MTALFHHAAVKRAARAWKVARVRKNGTARKAWRALVWARARQLRAEMRQ